MSTWPSPALSTTAVADAALGRLGSTLAVATGLASTGRAVDLTGLQAAAGTLCAQILDLPPEVGLRFRPTLVDLQVQLAALESLIRHPPDQVPI